MLHQVTMVRCRFVYRYSLILFLTTLVLACDQHPLNSPYKSSNKNANTFYSSYTEPPKTLDPARSYNQQELVFTAQIYEPPLQYHYSKEPFELMPLTAEKLPKPRYWDEKNNEILSAKDNRIAFTSYDITIKPGIYYQPHPAFAKDEYGNYRYLKLSKEAIQQKKQVSDFAHLGSRELVARDYIYQIKRLASPAVNSPIFSVMQKHIVGLSEFNKNVRENSNNLQMVEIAGVKEIDRYTYRVTLYQQYPQFLYWLTMPFFAPMPWEADRFYNQTGMAEHNLSLDWYPVGTGPYMLTINNPHREILLEKNPNFHGETLLTQDLKNTVSLAKIDKLQYRLEPQIIPQWNKFLQGYYDISAVSASNFHAAVQISPDGKLSLTPKMQAKGIKLHSQVENGIFYFGFNMLDPVVGGYTNRARYLRQAISIAINIDEYISIFLNGGAILAHGMIPPGIFGYQQDNLAFNNFIYKKLKNGKIQQRSIQEAKRLLAKAGYPNGIDPKTGKPLILHFDTVGGAGPDEQSQFRWFRKQFLKLGINLQIRATQLNRFQEKVRIGNTQIFLLGWLADYPDPENFLFLFDSKNGKVKYGGENQTNYVNQKYDSLFEQMKTLPNSPRRQQIIDQMMKILWKDSPAIFGFYPKTYQLSHIWLQQPALASIINNKAKYRQISPKLRAELRQQWNYPLLWPLLVIVGLVLLMIVGMAIRLRQRKLRKPKLLRRQTSIE